jgi:hypothetical protein
MSCSTARKSSSSCRAPTRPTRARSTARCRCCAPARVRTCGETSRLKRAGEVPFHEFPDDQGWLATRSRMRRHGRPAPRAASTRSRSRAGRRARRCRRMRASWRFPGGAIRRSLRISTGSNRTGRPAIATLTSAGYSYNPLTTSFASYLATALSGIGGSAVSSLTMPVPQLLAGLVNALGGGPVSHLTSGMDQLLALLGGAIPVDPGAALIAWDDTSSVQQLLQWDDASGNPQYLEWDT